MKLVKRQKKEEKKKAELYISSTEIWGSGSRVRGAR